MRLPVVIERSGNAPAGGSVLLLGLIFAAVSTWTGIQALSAGGAGDSSQSAILFLIGVGLVIFGLYQLTYRSSTTISGASVAYVGKSIFGSAGNAPWTISRPWFTEFCW